MECEKPKIQLIYFLFLLYKVYSRKIPYNQSMILPF